jgi:ABC-type long-subunit fatty acid transport system fused permease/ATPase subunit
MGLLIVHGLFLLVCVITAAVYGRSINKSGLFAFPLVAALFDLIPILSMIPLVPTVLHIIAIVTGLFGTAKVQDADADEPPRT